MENTDKIPLWLKGVCVLVGLLLFAPTVILIPLSFTGELGFRFPPRSWSMQHYVNFFTDPGWVAALGASLSIGVQVMFLATIIGTAAAVGLSRVKPQLKAGLNAIFLAPILIPSVIIAIGVYAIFLRLGLTGTPLGFVLTHTAMAIPFVVIAVTASLSNLDRGLEKAAATLGAPPWRVLFRVTIPQLLPGILSGAVFAFATSFDEVMISLYMSSSTLVTLPVKMFQSVTNETDPTIAVASTIILVVTTVIILLPLLTRKRQKNG